MDPIFAATPPLEALRDLLTIAASEDPRRVKQPIRVGIYDVSRAHFYADAIRKVLIRLPREDPRAGEKGLCGRLLKTMYGTLDAAARWEVHYSEKLIKQAVGKAGRRHASTTTQAGTSG